MNLTNLILLKLFKAYFNVYYNAALNSLSFSKLLTHNFPYLSYIN